MFESRKRKRHTDLQNKRKHRRNDYKSSPGSRTHDREPDGDSLLFIQAYEADLHHGPQVQELAKSLEVLGLPKPPVVSACLHSKIGSALIRWAGGSSGPQDISFGDQDDTFSLGTQPSPSDLKSIQGTSGIWVDRFDARLLLDALPNFNASQPAPDSPSGWSDLPSDTETTFFFSPEETDEHRREKRRQSLIRAHEERVRARSEEEKEEMPDFVIEDPWGGSDEEPDEAQKDLMRRTATHLITSPNPAQLEMRILANHGADKRFAFLKGRWSRSWSCLKTELRIDKEEKERKEKQEKGEGLGLLVGYDSGSESMSNGEDVETRTDIQSAVEKTSLEADEKKKELRRQRAKEWAEKRRAEVKTETAAIEE